MVNAGTAAIRQMSDGWTVKTRDGKYAAHYENTILITAGEPEILTDRKSTRLNSSHSDRSRMPSSA